MVNTCGSRLTTSTSSTSLNSESVCRVCFKSARLRSARSSSVKIPARRDLPRRKGFTGTIAQNVISHFQYSLAYLLPTVFYLHDFSLLSLLHEPAYSNPVHFR